MSDLKGAIIGCGGRARGHAQGYQQAAGVTLSAVADMDRERADKFSADYGVPAFYDAAEMLDKVKPEVVSVVTRAKGRSALVQLCAEKGVPAVDAEKPMAITMSEADAMVEACRKSGTALTVSHQMRYSANFERGKQALEAGDIGEVYFLRAVCFGNLMNQGTHVIDMLRWYMNDARVTRVMAQADEWDSAQRDVGHPAPMWTLGYLVFENGVRATIESGPSYAPALGTNPGWLNKRVEVLGTEGMLDTVVANYTRILSTKRGGWYGSELGVEDSWNHATIKFIEDLARVVREGGTHRNNAETSLHSFEIIQALAKSAHHGGWVDLPLPRDGTDFLGELLAARTAG